MKWKGRKIVHQRHAYAESFPPISAHNIQIICYGVVLQWSREALRLSDMVARAGPLQCPDCEDFIQTLKATTKLH